MNTRNQPVSALWQDEKDWLITLIMLPDFAPERARLANLNWVGRAAAFAWCTDTRLLAKIGDPDMPCYELWFSFPNEISKRQFLELVREDGFCNPDRQGEDADFQPPASGDYLAELEDLRPLATVFPEKQTELILGVMAITINDLKEKGRVCPESMQHKPN